MHIMTKLTLGAGAVLLIGSIIAIVVGGGSFMGDITENPNGTEKWNGTSPTTYEGEFLFSGIYHVFAEDGANISVEFIDGDETSGFNSCEEDQSCDFVKWAGYTYLGTISVYEEGTYEVNFTGDGDVMIREMFIDVGGIMTAAGGMGGICCSFCVLGLGIIFIFTLKDNKAQQGVMMVQQSDGTFQQVGGMAAPVQGAPTVAGGVHPAYATQQPIIQQPAQQGEILPPGGQQPPNQGF